MSEPNKTSYEFNYYDLNMAKSLKEDIPYALEREIVNNHRFKIDQYIESVWLSVKYYCADLGLNYGNLIKASPAVPIIIDSSHNLYFPLLQVALTFYDPFLIKHFLTYQFNNFKGNAQARNKDEFLGQILFITYDSMRLGGHNDNLHRREKIIDWLESHNIENLPERFSSRQTTINDRRYKGNLTPQEVSEYWMQLCAYKVNRKGPVEVLNAAEVEQFMHANFWGINPQIRVIKLKVRNISQTEFRKFCKAFFDEFKSDNRSMEFIKILKANFSIFDNTKAENLKKDFSKK